jgi:hypothetical protein
VALVFSDRQRSDSSPRSAESQYAFLDRVAGPVWDRIRQLIENWVSDYSAGDRPEMIARLQGRKDDIAFAAAYWELLLYQGLKTLGFEVTCHPQLAGTTKRPDFLVAGDTCSFYLEAKVLGDDRVDLGRDQRRNKIYHELNAKVHSDDFFVQVQFDRESARPIPIRRLADATQIWLNGLDPAKIRKEVAAAGPLGTAPLVWEDQRSGWTVTVVPMPKRSSQSGDRVVGLTGGDASYVDDRTPIRKALDEKAHRYGNELDKPFVVGLGILRPFADDMDMMDALFGDDVYIFDPATNVGRPARRPNGLWIGPEGPRCQRLSAVLVTGFVAPWIAAKTELRLWKNPWATLPLRCDGGGVVTIIDPKDDGSLVATAATKTTGELFGLPPDWPGPEPAFPQESNRDLTEQSS